MRVQQRRQLWLLQLDSGAQRRFGVSPKKLKAITSAPAVISNSPPHGSPKARRYTYR
jgi:hypothetical protein